MLLAFIIHIPLLILIAIYLNKKCQATPLAKYYWPSLLIKLSAGIMIGLIYTYYYPYDGDTFQYHYYSKLLTQISKQNPTQYLKILFTNQFNSYESEFASLIIQPRALFFVKILSAISILTFSTYWINALYLSLFCFIGLWACGESLIKTFKVSPHSIFLSFFVLPSFVLWSSGVLKESIVIGIIGFLISIFISTVINKKFSLLQLLIFLFLFLIGWKIKFFFFAILIGLMIALTLVILLNQIIPSLKNYIKNILMFIFFTSIIFFSTLLIPILNLHYLIEIMYISYSDMLRYTMGENFTFHNLQPNLISYLLNLPEALLTGLFRPFLWEVRGFLPTLETIENLFITIFTFGALYKIYKTKRLNISPPVLALLIYIFATAALMAFIAPNWGTLSRYKTGFLMFYVLLIIENNPILYLLNKKNHQRT